MTAIIAMNDAAEKEGFAFPDSVQEQFDASMESLEAVSKQYGYTAEQYLKMIYGSTMTMSMYESLLMQSLRADAYSYAYNDSLEYTASDLNAGYLADTKAYDIVNYESVRLNGAVPTKDAEGNEVEVTDEMKAEALDTAKKSAQTIFDGYKAGNKLSDLADEDSIATYTEGKNSSY